MNEKITRLIYVDKIVVQKSFKRGKDGQWKILFNISKNKYYIKILFNIPYNTDIETRKVNYYILKKIRKIRKLLEERKSNSVPIRKSGNKTYFFKLQIQQLSIHATFDIKHLCKMAQGCTICFCSPMKLYSRSCSASKTKYLSTISYCFCIKRHHFNGKNTVHKQDYCDTKVNLEQKGAICKGELQLSVHAKGVGLITLKIFHFTKTLEKRIFVCIITHT